MAITSTLFTRIKMGNQQLVLNTIIMKVNTTITKENTMNMMEINMITKENTMTMIMMAMYLIRKM